MTITKFLHLVIFWCLAAGLVTSCSMSSGLNVAEPDPPRYLPPELVGNIADPEIKESSGLIASKCHPDALWTHNDSGDDAFIYALNRSGAKLGTFAVPNAHNIDWEDIAGYKDRSGKCFIYIGEIGDNEAKRSVHTIYRLKEPPVTAEEAGTTRERPAHADAAEALDFSYPDGNYNAETLLVQPGTAQIYVITKQKSGPAGVYKLASPFGAETTVTAEKVAEISVPAIPNGYLTGGDISPDGRRVIISDYVGGYEFELPDGDSNFDDIWKQQPRPVDLGRRRVGESVCYSADGNAIYASSEGKHAPIFEIRRRP